MLMGSVRYMGKRVREQKPRSNRGEEEMGWRDVKKEKKKEEHYYGLLWIT